MRHSQKRRDGKICARLNSESRNLSPSNAWAIALPRLCVLQGSPPCANPDTQSSQLECLAHMPSWTGGCTRQNTC
eukprot:2379603-Pleurochrysis_carterae.AAC.2